ncbi:hypothetical protein Bhyg_06484 [Pseudolycoriella hygida]|uniref:Uncharacterized protein n=1 Tax=Pseudolycoriella hygida TaxID=35572 RepID=A0A9Q0S2W0_9DIPT|nr:hypothetical protein Bhyg_06484 [Pseudolycoriella hygida]
MLYSSVIWLLFTLQVVWSVQNYKKCNTSYLKNGCPDGTKCTQISETNSSYDGECHCIGDNNEFNKYYKSDTDYCVYVEPKHFDNRVMASKSSSTSEERGNNADNSHHIVGGILISICLVVIFTLIVIGVNKLHIKQRIRNLRMTQRNRPLYEDVMMGNDTDDPPLI